MRLDGEIDALKDCTVFELLPGFVAREVAFFEPFGPSSLFEGGDLAI